MNYDFNEIKQNIFFCKTHLELKLIKKELNIIKKNFLKENNFDALNVIKYLEKQIRSKHVELKNYVVEEQNIFFNIEKETMFKKSIVSWVQTELENIFLKLQYVCVEGNDIENISTVFNILNIDSSHEAASKKQTFFIEGINKKVLRPHTTGMNDYVRNKPSLLKQNNWFSTGLVYRRDNDKNHLPCFHQFDISSIQKPVSVLYLQELIINVLSILFTRYSTIFCVPFVSPLLIFRPHFFPYTSPSYELDICVSKENDIYEEVLGCGILNESVLNQKAIAAGLGIERICLILNNCLNVQKYKNIKDLLI